MFHQQEALIFSPTDDPAHLFTVRCSFMCIFGWLFTRSSMILLDLKPSLLWIMVTFSREERCAAGRHDGV